MRVNTRYTNSTRGTSSCFCWVVFVLFFFSDIFYFLNIYFEREISHIVLSFVLFQRIPVLKRAAMQGEGSTWYVGRQITARFLGQRGVASLEVLSVVCDVVLRGSLSLEHHRSPSRRFQRQTSESSADVTRGSLLCQNPKQSSIMCFVFCHIGWLSAALRPQKP